MVTEPHFQLTTKDHAVLQEILERYRKPHGPYLALLERKVRDSVIYFGDDIPPGVITLDSQATYFVNGVRNGPHLIFRGDEGDERPAGVSILTLRGLALLGLAEGGSIVIDHDAATSETLVVEDVISQPEAEARMNETAKGLIQGDSAGRTGNIVSFRRPVQPAFTTNSDDDDPGPHAA